MNRTATRTESTSLITSRPLPAAALAEPGRLVVVISELESEAELAGKLLPLAKDRGLSVMLLGVASGYSHETALRRRLVILAAFIRDGGVRVEIQVDYGRNWIEGLKMIVHENDVLACSVDDTAGEARTPISDILARQLGLPVHVFVLSHRREATRWSIGARLAAWAGSVAIIAGFFWLQLPVARAGNETDATAVLLLSLPLEVALIWVWNSLWG